MTDPESSVAIVFFDLDGTLLHNPEHFPSVFLRILADHGLERDPLEVQAAVRETWAWYEANVGRYAGRETAFWQGFNRQVCEALDAGDRAEALGQSITEIFSDLDQPTLYDDARPCLDTLWAAGLRLGVITARPDARRLLAPLGLTHRFELLADGFSAGSAKHDPTIYRHALARAKVSPEQALHVGDQYTRDIQLARAAGLHAVLLDRNNETPEADCPHIQSLTELPALVNPGGCSGFR